MGVHAFISLYLLEIKSTEPKYEKEKTKTFLTMAFLLPSSARNQQNVQDFINEEVFYLSLLQEFDLRINEIVFTATCCTWNVNWPNQILDGLLFIVKRTFEPTFQIIVKPTLPGSKFCQFHCVESFGQIKDFEEVEHSFLLPGQKKGFEVCFNNLEDSTRAVNCIISLLDTAPTLGIEEERRNVTEPSIHVGITREESSGHTGVTSGEITELNVDKYQQRVEPIQEEGQRENVVDPSTHVPITREERLGNTDLPIRHTGGVSGEGYTGVSGEGHTGVASESTNRSVLINIGTENEEEHGVANAFDQHLYLQNTRVIMAMIAILLATIILTVRLNPPASITTLGLKMTFQICFWIGAVSSLAALFLLCMLTPTSFDMQSSILRRASVATAISMISVVVVFGSMTVCLNTDPVTMIVGGIIGFIGIIIFSYLISVTTF